MKDREQATTTVAQDDDALVLADGASHMDEGATRVSRRDMIKVAASAAVAAPLIKLGETEAVAQRRAATQSKPAPHTNATTTPAAPRFFTREEFAMVDELTELIIPTDEHSPGARAAGVASFIDRQLAESDPRIPEYAKEHEMWRNGLKLTNAISQELHKTLFMQATEIQRIGVLTRMSQKEVQAKPAVPKEDVVNRETGQSKTTPPTEEKPQRPDLAFFDLLKAQTVRAYYTSEIGLHKEIQYKGNQYLKQFVGYDAT